MDKEEFERLKAEEKKHLQELKKLKTQYKEAKRTQKLRQAMAEINATVDPDAVKEKLIDEELKADLPSEEDKAADLIKQFKVEMGMIDEIEEEAEEGESEVEKTIGKMPAEDLEEVDPEDSSQDVPEKTLGRIRRKVDSELDPDESEPETD